MNTRKRKFPHELARIIERCCNADLFTAGTTEALRNRVTIETITGAAQALQPTRRGKVGAK